MSTKKNAESGILDRIANSISNLFNSPKVDERMIAKQPVAGSNLDSEMEGGKYNNVWTVGYDGEKDAGEVGPIINYWPNYEALRLRSWQCFLESDIAQIAFGRWATWMIGTGLRLQATPNLRVLAMNNIKIDGQKFSLDIESLFSVWGNTPECHYSKNMNFVDIMTRALLNAVIGGDVLVVLRLEEGIPTIELIDGCHVKTPMVSTSEMETRTENGNTITYGVERDKKKKIVAYWVFDSNTYDWQRIEATNTGNKLRQAFMVYGLDYRLDEVRGMPLISAVIEKGAKMDRYMEATLGTAEERAKQVLYIKHNQYSTGEFPWAKNVVSAMNADKPFDIATTADGDVVANKLAVTTKKQVTNLGNGQDVGVINSTNELHFKDFYTTNFDFYCAAINIPPNIALQKYDANFSASRAALKDWENTLLTKRGKFSREFMQNVYQWVMHIFILQGRVAAPGYIKGDWMVLSAYRMARFVGAKVPHIDPVKEVNAQRLMLGPLGANIPLTDGENAVEALGGGTDSSAIMEQFSRELDEMESYGMDLFPPTAPVPEAKETEE